MSAQCHEHTRPVLYFKLCWIIQGKSFNLLVFSFSPGDNTLISVLKDTGMQF